MTTAMSDSPGQQPPQRAKTGNVPHSEPERAASEKECTSDAESATEEHAAAEQRWLCSVLVVLEWLDENGTSRSQTGNLEEVWPEGALVDVEKHIPDGTRLRIELEKVQAADSANPPETTDSALHTVLEATTLDSMRSATGYALRIEFLPGSQWDLERFPLAHAVSADELQRKANALAAGASESASAQTGNVASGVADAVNRAADEALEQGSLFCLALQAGRR
ncbi:MAG: hypothetical protein LC114_14245 [Bryobacterales bacterium]|nr:hypothetical protein [Bryobacterales bacterium]